MVASTGESLHKKDPWLSQKHGFYYLALSRKLQSCILLPFSDIPRKAELHAHVPQ